MNKMLNGKNCILLNFKLRQELKKKYFNKWFNLFFEWGISIKINDYKFFISKEKEKNDNNVDDFFSK